MYGERIKQITKILVVLWPDREYKSELYQHSVFNIFVIVFS
jgi:hypothetical protein